ncbi:flagellar hook-associated protein 3 [Butyrivibrio sp. X503]|uniref:flagellar hook-associated protein FlgL n=1 Tax=Butyrivibrio sp. X503 TaxID=2364878 RepID=UPI000EA8ADD1|nr:flagellar hook-associated protein FlgL [Butyrivibrio sp. X503]RKM54328.1 flagellar hook-associated protein 3 [Butyrivibrio sp. X503]
MRITNKIMQNNSLYNINNNKVSEDQLNTMMSTGKKITRPSDDPVIAIRALRLRSNVTQLSQYYEKNAKDAESWLNVTADALSTVTSVLTDCVKQATKGANMDLTTDDLSTIVTQMDALAKEYYSTGNVDFAGRYIFTGYRTDTPLTFDKTTTADYTGINDEFNASNIGWSNRVAGMSKLDSTNILDANAQEVRESDIQEYSVGKIRLSYDNLNYRESDPEFTLPTLKWREQLTQPATSSVEGTSQLINLTFTTTQGETHHVSLPSPIDLAQGESYTVTSEDIEYNVTAGIDGSYTIKASEATGDYKFFINSNGVYDSTAQSSNVLSGQVSMETVQKTTLTFTNEDGERVRFKVPLVPAIGQSYSMRIENDGRSATAIVNSDGTYTVIDKATTSNPDGTFSTNVINVTGNGSVYSSYKETSLEIGGSNIIFSTTSQEEIDNKYRELDENKTGALAYLNVSTGEVLLNKELTDKLSTLPDLINANSIDVVYDKKEFVDGDIRPQNLFNCNYTDENGKTVLYNKGSASHNIAYDVGFAQSVVVNTTADAVFTTSVKRDVDDLSTMIEELKQMEATIKILEDKHSASSSTSEKERIKVEIDAAKKAFNYQRENIQKEFEHKITSLQKSLDTANIAVTDNGTRCKRLDLINSRLMTQTTTFKTLQSENEDIDLAETITQLTSAQVTYEASLMATGKISQNSLMNYI